MKKKYTVVIIVAVILFAGLSYVIYHLNDKSLSFVSISINPDVELAVNDNNIVEEVIPINADADVIVSDLDLVGTNIEEASEAIIDAAIETGYIDEYSDENTIVITTLNEDEGVRKALEDKVIARLNTHLETRKIYPILVANGLDDELKSQATQYGISNGKMLLVNRAVLVNPELSKATLADMTVKEIQQEIRAYVKARHATLKTTKEELKTKWQAEKATLKENYKSKVETLKNTLLENAGINTDKMTVVEKNRTVSEVIKAKKEQIKEDIAVIKEELQNTTQTKTYPALKNTIKNIKERIKQRVDKEE